MIALAVSALFYTETLYPEWQQQLQIDQVLCETRTEHQNLDFVYYNPKIHQASFALPQYLAKFGDHSLLADKFSQILLGIIPPIIWFSCPDSAETRAQLINEIAYFYSAFLTRETHEKENKERLRSHHMWLDLTPTPSYPSESQISTFIRTLKIMMSEELATQSDTLLRMDYGPDAPPLEKAFTEANMSNHFFKLLPYKSRLRLSHRQGILTVQMDLTGPLF